MTTKICPFCGREFSSGNSYRVHKSKYHRGESVEQASDTIDMSESEPQVIEEPAQESPSESEEPEERSGSGLDWLLGLGGLAGLLLLFFLGRGGGQQ